MVDLYIQVLVILENDTDYPTNEHKAVAVRKLPFCCIVTDLNPLGKGIHGKGTGVFPAISHLLI